MINRTGIDLFAGCGGFSLGMKKAGFDVLVAVEIDKWAAETYRHNLGRVTKHNPKATIVMEEDIKQITPRRLLKMAGVKRGELDILFGSPPCQGFSTANSKNRGLDNPKSQLMHEFIRMTKGVQAKIFFLENVLGMLAYKDFFILVMQKFEECGYIVRCLMMDAADYGVPQRRKRIFIQGVRKGLNFLPTFPPPTHHDPERDKKVSANNIPPSALKGGCFATNGFAKEEVKDLYWNSVLNIQMNRKTAPYVLNVAIGALIGEGIKRCVAKDKAV